MLYKWLIGNEQNIDRNSRFWNTIGGGLNAIQSAVILVFFSHIYGQTISGVVTFAYAVGTLFLSIGKYGMRNYQVTDVDEEYHFLEYRVSRSLVIASLLLVSIGYGFFCKHIREYTLEKSVIIVIIVVFRMLDAWEDTYIGRYQQNGRLDIGAKILTLRMIVSTFLICILSFTHIEISLIFIVVIVVAVGMDVWAIYATKSYLESQINNNLRKKKIGSLLWETLPLCIGTTLSILIGNIPKYMINHYLDDQSQAVFGYIMMPVFCIMLLSTFIYMPKVKSMGDLWNKHDFKGFHKSIYLQLLYIGVITILVCVLGVTIGIPILSIMYNVILEPFRIDFLILLIGGGFYAMAYYLNVPITAMRYQKILVWGYIAITIFTIIIGRILVDIKGIRGACVLYLISNASLFGVYLVMSEILIKKRTVLSAQTVIK